MRPLNPEDIEAKLRALADQIHQLVTAVDTAYAEFLRTDRDYDLAYARAFVKATGTETHRKQSTVIAVASEREARDVADAAYRYVKNLADAKSAELNAYQSVGALIREVYRGAGRA